MLGLAPALIILCSIPFGEHVVVAGYTIPLQVIRLDVGFLIILAFSGMGIYGVVLSGWASASKFSLLGSLRASAQMVSYEIPLGLSLIPIVLIYDSVDLTEIVRSQGHVWEWGACLAPVSFLLFLVCMFAETNRAPFDLAEGESELVAGFHTEFGSSKFALFYLTEYINMFALSCLCAVLFLGGWNLPFVSQPWLIAQFGLGGSAAINAAVLLAKAGIFLWLFVWVRWTIPRLRYDQLMAFGWKFLLPVGLGNVVVTAGILSLGF